jgi:hypothetical protein
VIITPEAHSVNRRSGPALTFTVTLFRNVFDSSPSRATLSRSQLLDLVGRHQPLSWTGEFDRRLHLPAWSPAWFESSRRCNEDAIEICALTFDIDGGASLDQVAAQFSGHPRVVASTPSHHPEQPRFRLVVPMDEPVPAAEWSSVWTAALGSLSVEVDRVCSDSARLYFLPVRLPQGAPAPVWSSTPKRRFLDGVDGLVPTSRPKAPNRRGRGRPRSIGDSPGVPG